MKAPTLVFGWGNPSRGDDALGPLFVERIEGLALPGVACLTDFQLQVEHALDLQGRRRILFVDASVAVAAPFTAGRILPARDESFTTHAMTPQAVLQVYCEVEHEDPPAAWLLAIRGRNFTLGEAPCAEALDNLAAAQRWAIDWLKNPDDLAPE